MFSCSFIGVALLYLVTLVAGSAPWQHLTLPNTNITFGYLDSGPVHGCDTYTTLVLLHGMGYNSIVFDKIRALAPANHVRIVAVNRRDYAPTSPLDTAELAVLSQGDSGSAAYLQQRGNEIGLFIDKWIQNNHIPTARPNGDGGVSLVGWSLGTVTATAFLAHLDTLPQATIKRLAPYFHNVLLHDTFATAVGFPNPPEFDISILLIPDPVARFQAFDGFVTAYYQNTDYNPATGSEFTLDYNTANPHKANTFSNISPSLKATMTDEPAYGGSETNVLLFSQAAYSELTRRALFDATLAKKLPNVKVRYYYAAETPGIMVLGCWDVTEAGPSYYNGVHARDINLHYGTSGNHFFFYDNPSYALQQYLHAINS
ncbi:hypothetical protein BDN72DRAFT_61092 [Pluteus cervinus]|uniref:Uncharacterized protein n=1 Tax=Pluteus cervinus TaxID=181527 RepID=A0ACD3AQV3_9AGAR|nr:hypothetical protein BDN72DRAFT_61092 [Pluteus cervinus]